jgi:hypothetical protein
MRLGGRMSMNIKILAALALTASLALTAELETKPVREPQKRMPEPIVCYRLLGLSGLEITVGQSVELCAATHDAAATFECFSEAWGNPADGGLGLTRGQAVDLCRTIPRESA